MTYRITWTYGKAHLERCPPGGTWDRDGEIVRPATGADRKAMFDGRIQYDPGTHPSTLAWEAHIARGGD